LGKWYRIFVKKDIPDEIPEFVIPDGEKENGKIWIVKLLVLSKMVKSNSEGRRLISGGGVHFDGNKIDDVDFEFDLPVNGIMKVGKRRFIRISG